MFRFIQTHPGPWPLWFSPPYGECQRSGFQYAALQRNPTMKKGSTAAFRRALPRDFRARAIEVGSEVHGSGRHAMDLAAARATAQESKAILTRGPGALPAWAQHKLARVRQRLADVAWYLSQRMARNGMAPTGYMDHRNLVQIHEDASWIAEQGPVFPEWVSDHLSTAYTDVHDVYTYAVRLPRGGPVRALQLMYPVLRVPAGMGS